MPFACRYVVERYGLLSGFRVDKVFETSTQHMDNYILAGGQESVKLRKRLVNYLLFTK